MEKGFKAKQQACKKSIDNGGAWRIFNRLDSSKVTGGRLRATMTVLHNNHTTNRSWESGWVRKGTISDVGTVVIPREPGYSLAMSLAADQAGNGGAADGSRHRPLLTNGQLPALLVEERERRGREQRRAEDVVMRDSGEDGEGVAARRPARAIPPAVA